jgi:hypothetical protein
MNDFLKKLNVLIKASLNEAVSGEHGTPSGAPSGGRRSSTRGGMNLEADVNAAWRRWHGALPDRADAPN